MNRKPEMPSDMSPDVVKMTAVVDMSPDRDNNDDSELMALTSRKTG